MTLRLRMVLGVVVLVTAGLGLFGVATYTLYARSQYQRLDDQAHNAAPLLSRRLAESAGIASDDHGATSASGASGASSPSGASGATNATTPTTAAGTAATGSRDGGPPGPIGAYGE